MSDKTLRLVCRVLLWVMLAVSVIFMVVTFLSIKDGMSKMAQAMAVSPFLSWTVCLAIVGVALAVVFPIFDVLQYPRKLVKVLLSLGGLGLVLLVAYLCADATPIVTATSASNPDFADRGVLLLADTGLIACYLLFAIAFVLLIVTGVRSSLRR